MHPSPIRAVCVYAVLAAAALAFVLVVAPASIDVPRAVPQTALSPRFLPDVLAGAVGLLSLVGIARAGLSLRRRPSRTMAGEGSPRTAAERVRPLLALALLCLSWPLSPLLGMAATGGLIAAALTAVGGERRVWPYLVVATVLPLLVSLFFGSVLNVPLPAGSLLR